MNDIYNILLAYMYDLKTPEKYRRYKKIEGIEKIEFLSNDGNIVVFINYGMETREFIINTDGMFLVSFNIDSPEHGAKILQYYSSILYLIREQVIGL